MDRGAWRATVRGVTKNQTRLAFTFTLLSLIRKLRSLSVIQISQILSHMAIRGITSSFTHSVQFNPVQSLSCVRLFATPWTIDCQAPLFMKFSRQEYWSGLPLPSPGIFPTQGLSPSLLHHRQILYHLSHQGSSTN